MSRSVGNRIIKKLSIGFQTQVIREQNPYTFDKAMLKTSKKNVYYAGNWQNYRYFDDYYDELKELFRLQYAMPVAFSKV